MHRCDFLVIEKNLRFFLLRETAEIFCVIICGDRDREMIF